MVCKNLKILSVYIKDLDIINCMDILQKNCNDDINLMLCVWTVEQLL